MTEQSTVLYGLLAVFTLVYLRRWLYPTQSQVRMSFITDSDTLVEDCCLIAASYSNYRAINPHPFVLGRRTILDRWAECGYGRLQEGRQLTYRTCPCMADSYVQSTRADYSRWRVSSDGLSSSLVLKWSTSLQRRWTMKCLCNRGSMWSALLSYVSYNPTHITWQELPAIPFVLDPHLSDITYFLKIIRTSLTNHLHEIFLDVQDELTNACDTYIPASKSTFHVSYNHSWLILAAQLGLLCRLSIRQSKL